MPARVFAALLATDSGRLTAAQLADLLHVSPAAISGAVSYLVQVNLASREAEPGSRREHYRVHNETWYEAIARKDQVLDRCERSLREGIDVVGRDTPAGDIVRAVQSPDRSLIAGVRVFDVYEGAGVGDGRKSVAVEVTIQPREKTLADAEIEALSARIVAAAAKSAGATLRG